MTPHSHLRILAYGQVSCRRTGRSAGKVSAHQRCHGARCTASKQDRPAALPTLPPSRFAPPQRPLSSTPVAAPLTETTTLKRFTSGSGACSSTVPAAHKHPTSSPAGLQNFIHTERAGDTCREHQCLSHWTGRAHLCALCLPCSSCLLHRGDPAAWTRACARASVHARLVTGSGEASQPYVTQQPAA